MRPENTNEIESAEHKIQTAGAEGEGLSDADLEKITAGALSSAVSELIKNFGGALQTAARG
jgi:hypothetical protein